MNATAQNERDNEQSARVRVLAGAGRIKELLLTQPRDTVAIGGLNGYAYWLTDQKDLYCAPTYGHDDNIDLECTMPIDSMSAVLDMQLDADDLNKIADAMDEWANAPAYKSMLPLIKSRSQGIIEQNK